MISGAQLHQVDVLVIGAGAAGLTAALSVPEHLSVAILSKDPSGGSTRWAQGGVAAVIDDEDSIESHVQDTLIAGAGLCHQDVVENVVSNALEAIDWIVQKVIFRYGITGSKSRGGERPVTRRSRAAW